MWKVIYFSMHFESTAYFVPRLSPGLVIFQNYHFCSFFFLPYPPSASPPLPPSLVKLVGTLPVSSLYTTHTSLRSAISPSFPFPSLFLFYVCSSTRLCVQSYDGWRRRRVGVAETVVTTTWSSKSIDDLSF